MQPTKVKTSILTATGLISHTTKFRVDGEKYVVDLGEGETIEIAKRDDGTWQVCTSSESMVFVRETKNAALSVAAGIAMRLAMCTD